MTSTDIPEKTRKLIRDREEGMCALCRAPMTDIHHLRPKGMGGTSDATIHRPSNLLGLDRRCHGFVHHNVAVAEAGGWIRPTAGVWMQNVNMAWTSWFLLHDDGTVTWLTDDGEPEHMPPWMPRLREGVHT